MILPSSILLALAVGQAAPIEDAHRQNVVYRALLEEGLAVEGQRVKIPPPRLRDGQPAAEQKAILKEVAGSERAVPEFLRDSVSAPFILKVRDEKAEKDPLIRGGDLWFTIRADLDAIDPSAEAKRTSEAKPVEAGNMRFTSRLLDDKALSSRGLAEPAKGDASHRWYVHFAGTLLDRIHAEATSRVEASKSSESWVIASRTDPKFDEDAEFPNRWWPILRSGGRDAPGQAKDYSGGASYVKISRLSAAPGMLLVESHFAFAEPRAWFDGAPILRSKLSLIAQDQIRSLRRELAKGRERPSGAGRKP